MIRKTGPFSYTIDNGRGTTLRVYAKGENQWVVNAHNAATRAYTRNAGGYREFPTIEAVEGAYKSCKGLAAMVKKTEHLDQACEMLDAQILDDIVGDGPKNYQAVVCIGIPREMNAGIYGGALTPWFNSIEELNTFCGTYKEQIQQLAENDGFSCIDGDGKLVK